MTTTSDTSASPRDLSLDEQAALTSGASFWTTKSIGDVAGFTLEDGPHGVRHQTAHSDHLGISPSEPATCFPPATALAQTWDVELAARVGEALGIEARHHGVDVLLGPGVNIKRDPRCGRNFEYFSEDPLLSGSIGAAWVRGLQSCGVGASVKHFAANNQETERMRVSADVDEKALREIYLRSFERVVRGAQPWTMMASYNRLNGTPTTEHRWLLTEILRGEWGFDGAVVSDWGAVRDRPAALAAGLDLQMPGGDAAADAEVAEAVREGRLDESAVARAADAVASVAARAAAGRAGASARRYDENVHHELAREVASRAIVLLRNDPFDNGAPLLPLDPSDSVAVIGPFAAAPRIQGGGSSRVNPTKVDDPIGEIRRVAPDLRYAPGYRLDGETADDLRAEALDAAGAARTAIVFVGLDSTQEIEGTDRSDLEIPADQLELVSAVRRAQPRTVVVLVHGGVLRLGALRDVPALVDAAILGQAGGGAVADVLFGAVNPSGRLGETVPVRLSDAPSYLNFPGDGLHVRYGEGIFVGYRGYDASDREVEFPFGHGLSYSTFSYGDLSATEMPTGVEVSVAVTNESARAGREVVQFYGRKASGPGRPPRELVAFEVVDLAAGEAKTVTARIPRHEFAIWDVRSSQWRVEGGTYPVSAGASSRDLRVSTTVHIEGDERAARFTGESTLAELLAHPASAAIISEMLQANAPESSSVASDELGIDANASAMRIPVSRIRSLSGGRGMDPAQLESLLALANGDARS